MAGSTSKTSKSTDYEFQTVWRVAGTREEVVDVLGDASTLPQWWPAVYLDVTPVSPGKPDGTGNAVDLHTKGWFPYTLRWRLTLTEPVSLHGWTFTGTGDLNGTGAWKFETDGPEVVVTNGWRVSTAKPLLRRLSWLLKPAFSANHHWAMARGEESLKLELRRRRSTTDRASVPPPPGPTFTSRRNLTQEGR
ncbi:SRPBCC family protein [Paenarthrobacter sp. AB444]|uniref:SRPBCC family protein n=1 Tax=Paenarthrobacter sp. AB444 TaxID=3025681 RepID=UPI002366ADB6|nr:SRPBCC family protein [Paenarthrobacter sp. AB444]MDD7836002.1 SRPBCC family protein [Paenarthrobacter sp. AB444]